MSVQTCPTAETLGQFLLGRIDSPESDALSQHLLQCATCAALAESLPANDELTAAIREGVEIPDENEELFSVIEYSKGLFSRADTIRNNQSEQETKLPGNSEALPQGDVSPYSYLSPPTVEGDLGRLGAYRVLEVLGQGGHGGRLSGDRSLAGPRGGSQGHEARSGRESRGQGEVSARSQSDCRDRT